MTAIRTHESVFLGVVVNPKTKAPVYVVRPEATDHTVELERRRADRRADLGWNELGDL